jgi:glycerol-3-phosphate O-acyltransferase
MNKKSPYIQKVSKQKHLIPEIADWPLYQLYSNREGFIHEINQATLAHFENHTASEMKSILDKTMYQERVRMKRKAWKVDPPNEKLFWKRIASEIEEAEKLEVEEHKKQIFSELLLRVINRFSEEIAGNFSVKTFLFARKFLTFFFWSVIKCRCIQGYPSYIWYQTSLAGKFADSGPC